MAIGVDHEFSMICSNGHASYKLVSLLHADDDPLPIIGRTCPQEGCDRDRWVIDQCRAGERPLLKGRLV